MIAQANGWSTPVLRWIGVITIGAVSFYLALRNVSWSDLKATFQQADWRFVGLALLSVGFGVFAKVNRWRVLMGVNRQRVSYKKLLMSHLAGQSLNMIYPARVGDLSRVYVIGKEGISRMFVLGTVVLEKLWDMLSYTLVFLLLLLIIPLPDWVSESVYGVALITLSFFVVSFIVSYQRTVVVRFVESLIKWIPKGFHGRFIERMHAGLESLDVLQSSNELIELAFWTTIIWVTSIVNNYLVLLALKLRLPLAAPVLILVSLQAGISLPSIPGRLGIFQYICVLALGIYGIDQTLAISYSILLHSIALLTIILSGLVCAWILGVMKPNVYTG